MPKIRQLVCHDCHAVLSADDHRHYVYQCHDCVVVEHDLMTLAARDPGHPAVERLGRSAVLIGKAEALRR